MNALPQWPKADPRWYLGVRCQKCRTPILFALDRTEGRGDDASPSPGKLVLTCASEKCGHRADYTAASVSRFQKQSASVSPNKIERKNESSKARKPKRQ